MKLFFFVAVYREITFQNAEELTEEGLPFLILFYGPNDNKMIKDFKMNVKADLLAERRKLKSIVMISESRLELFSILQIM